MPDLFPHLASNLYKWKQLTQNDLEKYSPEASHSMNFTVKKVNRITNVNPERQEWQKCELFQTLISGETATIFCGGPVSSMAWAPTPQDIEVEQILAVSVAAQFNGKCFVDERLSGPGTIQLWNFGVLDVDHYISDEPKMEMCLCHDFGYVTHMEWCPSGCYAVSCERWSRLGLLAVASSDKFVHILAVPKPSGLK